VPGGDLAAYHPIGDAVSNSPRLAGAGAGKQADGAGRRCHGGPLLGVELGQQGRSAYAYRCG
jgi:hypothetical protein